MFPPLPPGPRRLSYILLAVVIPYGIYTLVARPSWNDLWIGLLIAAGSVVAGLNYRQTTTKEQRRRELRERSPWAARHLPPSPDQPKEKDDDTTVSW